MTFLTERENSKRKRKWHLKAHRNANKIEKQFKGFSFEG